MLDLIHKIKVVDGLLVMGLGFMAIGVGMSFSKNYQEEIEAEVIKAKPTPVGQTEIQSNKKVWIDIGGAVIKPGVYELKQGSRVVDALAKADGLTIKADRGWVDTNLNKASLLVDGQKIYIPEVGENKTVIKNDQFQMINKTSLISINSAGIEELDKLDGVGPSLAQRIIDYREQNGGFKSIEELKLVSGIGDKMFEKIKNKVGL